MEPTPITCTRVEQEDLDARYLAGALSDEEAEAFEEHYFGCDRCWSTVRRGLEVRAATDAPTPAPRTHARGSTVGRGTASRTPVLAHRRWRPVAIAAALALLAIGVWQRTERPEFPASDGVRGPIDSLRAIAFTRGRTLLVSWPPKRNADAYGVRLQKSDGTIVIDRATSDTVLAVSRDSLPGAADGERLYWEVRAFDPLRRTIARSGLVPAVLPTEQR